jgi:hypothetical protein
MTGEIIYFQGHLDLKRGQLYREQTVSRHAILAPVIPARSRAGGEAGRRILPMLPGSGCRDLADDGEGDPQPDIDCETLDRMYRDLKSGA